MWNKKPCWEQPPDGGYGAYEAKYQYRMYLVLHEMFSAEDPVGSEALRCVARLERKANTDIKVKYPLPGFEDKFRSDVKKALGTSALQFDSEIFLLITPKPLEDFHPDIHRFAVVDLMPFLAPDGSFRAADLVRSLSRISSALETKQDLFDKLQEEVKQNSDIRWVDVIEIKPSAYGFKLDLKLLKRKLLSKKR